VDVFTDVLEWIAVNIFGEVAILIGLITLVGLLLQRKPIEETIAGALRAAIGIVILFVGIGVFVEGLVAFQTIVASAAGLDPPAAENTLGDFLGDYGGAVALIITVAFFLHVLAVRFLRTRYVYLTGHLMFWISVVVAAALVQVFGDVDTWMVVLAGSVVVAAYWTIQPLYIAPLMRKVIGSDNWGYGHTSSLACFLAGTLGRFVGTKEAHDSERLKLPKRLSFFKDINVSTALVLTVIVVVAAIFADPDVLAEQAAAYNVDLSPWVWAFVAALRFAAGIAILLFGVRMFLAEIVPAFKGISERVIPGSRPALDAPTVFPFAPTAVMLGFLSGTVVFLILMGVFAAAGWFVLVPPMIMLFFPGGAAGVFGNAVAGWRGAVLGGVINGLFLAIGQAVTWGMLSDTAPELATLADPDWYVIIWVMMGIGAIFSGIGTAGIWGVPIVLGLVFAGWLILLKRRHVDVVEEPLPETTPFERPDVQQVPRSAAGERPEGGADSQGRGDGPS
jgi:ascorbate PTS system EIIC component